MEKPVIISIRGVQSLEPGEEDVMELVTQGVLRQEEGEGFSLSYLESELTGLEGQKHVSLYETPYGGLILGVNTHRAKADLGTAGGRLSIRYALEVDSQPIGENSFEIQVTEPHLTAPAPGQ